MNRTIYRLTMFAIIATGSWCLYAQENPIADPVQEVFEKKINDSKKTRRKNKKKKIAFNFDATELVDVINLIAAEKDINIVLPVGANAIATKVTLRMDEPVPLDKAWKMLHAILEIAGYSMIQKDDTYTIIKISPTISREPAPIFVGTEPDQLPNYEKRITLLYYLSHIKVPRAGAEAQSELDGILKELLSPTALIKYEFGTNALVLNDNANNIRSAMKVIKELDKPGFSESFEVVHLRYAQADIVADLFNKSILATTDPRARLNIRKPTEALYFPQGTRIIPESRTNSLFVLGTAESIERVKEFIIKYIDTELGSGKSILHTYQLQYLDADAFATVLNNIVQSAASGGTQQSKAAAGGPGGTERYFEDVIITTDKPGKKGAAGQMGEYSGGNKLIIAARNDDWERIKKIIEQLDTPQPQVIIEVLIADLKLNDDRILGNMMRNPKAIPLPQIGDSVRSMEFQAEHLVPGQVATSLQTPALAPSQSSIAVDLGKFNQKAGAVDIAAGLAAGSSILTINDNDGATWSILQVLQSYGQTKILSHPHVIATNNKKATVSIGEKRLVDAEAVGSSGGATTAKKEYIDANLVVNITPRISSAKTVNLTVEIDINEFSSTNLSDANKNTRKIKTNANIQSNDILALGGLIKVDTGIGLNETPLLGRIPILGWLFKRRQGSNNKNNLTVFIRPTVIEPRLRGGIGEYTKDYITLAQDYVREGMLFDNMKEPITRWFFKTGTDAEEAINLFVEQNKAQQKTFDEPKVPKTSPEKVSQRSEPAPETTTARAEQIKQLLADTENPLLATGQQSTSKAILNT